MRLVLTKDLGPLKEVARGKVNVAVEQFRSVYLTPGSAQAMIYAEKSAEIQRYRNVVARGETPIEADYPYAMIDAKLYGMTLDNGIAFLEFYGDQWRHLAPKTEEIRRGALVAIDNARTPAQIEQATKMDWSQLQQSAA